MPILKQEHSIFPDHLLLDEFLAGDTDRQWWCIYTLSRREKELMRRLHAFETPFYSPIITKRFRSPNGRMRTSYVPLFPNYVFLFGTDNERYNAMTTNCVSKYQRVDAVDDLVTDLRQIQNLVASGVPLTPESRLSPGDEARIRTGPFAGYEGIVIRREGKTRFLLSVRYLERGVSMEIDEGLLAPL